jgi:hypothetical protein
MVLVLANAETVARTGDQGITGNAERSFNCCTKRNTGLLDGAVGILRSAAFDLAGLQVADGVFREPERFGLLFHVLLWFKIKNIVPVFRVKQS